MRGDRRFGILGPLRVLDDGHPVELGPRKQQIVLAALLCNANSTVSVGALTEALWGERPPRTSRKNIQVYVSALRDLADTPAGTRISYGCGGYVFRAQPGELDSLAFEQRARGRHSVRHFGHSADIARGLTAALDMWRGPVLDGLRDVPLIDATARRLEQQFLDVLEDWAEAEIAAGGAAGVIERLTDAAARHPLRERLRVLQMTALRDIGRVPEALAIYDELRQALARELGLSPSPAVAGFYQTLLREQPPSRGNAPPDLLPWDSPRFTGRAELTAQLTDVLSGGSHRVVIVTGSAGAGKTALTVHVAHQLADRFPDGRFYLRVRREDGTPQPPEEAASWLLRAAGLGASAEPVRTWRLWLARHRALVVLDDARAEPEIRPLLPGAGESAVLVTARPRLAGLESACRLRVPAFEAAEALEFLERVIGPERIAADRPAAERIAEAAGFLPLGLRIAAERLALLSHVPLREYASRVADPPALLDELAAGDMTIRARMAEVLAGLPVPAREAMPRLGLLPDPVFTLHEAAVVMAADEDTTMRVLETMLEASIVTVPDVETMAHTVLYEIPRLTYAYAREIATGVSPR